jgi:hypothetical protein
MTSGDIVIGAPAAGAGADALIPGTSQQPSARGLVVQCPPGIDVPHYLILEVDGQPIIYDRREF